MFFCTATDRYDDSGASFSNCTIFFEHCLQLYEEVYLDQYIEK